MTKIELPSYLEQSDEVKDRFARMKKRPVALRVKDLNKEFITPQGKVIALKNINLSPLATSLAGTFSAHDL